MFVGFRKHIYRSVPQFLPFFILLIGGIGVARSDDAELLQRGRQIYETSCLKCHGKDGGGVEEHYDDPLIGDESVKSLATIIAETMPEEDPDLCVDEDALAVAAFIHESFYSEAAQVRNRPPRIKLARLTGEQLRQSLADLFSSFDNRPFIDDTSGFKGVYFDSGKFDLKKKKIERTDPILDFDFGHDSPGEGIGKEEFSIQWVGSLRPDTTGRYELIVRSTCSFQMYFGDDDRILFNNHVQSEGRDEFKRTMHLTAGRGYPLKIDFRQRKRKTELPPASFSFSWIPPGGVKEIVPARNVSHRWQPSTFALQTKLPADDRSYGYERGTSVDRQWDESVTRAAIEFSDMASSELWSRYRRRNRKKHKKDDPDRAMLRNYLSDLATRAFRGPLTDRQQDLYVNQLLEAIPDDADAIKTACLLMIKSPRFLYPSLDAGLTDSHRAASRLAFVLHDSIPLEQLRRRADQGSIANEKQIMQTARPMIDDYRTRAKMRSFLLEWLDVDEEEIAKDTESFEGFDESLVADLRVSLYEFLDQIVWSEKSDFRELVSAKWVVTSPRLQNFYGDGWRPKNKDETSGSKPFVRSVDNDDRVGALSHPLVMASHAYHKHTSPIHRGVFVYRKVLGRTLRPPNAAFSPLNPDLHPKLTTRQRVELQTAEVNCQVCHAKINAVGFALENFDAVGRFRDQENGQKIDATGHYLTRAGNNVQFGSPAELADFLVSSEDVHRAFVDSCFEYFTKQPTAAYGPDTLDKLTTSFRESDFNIQSLIADIAITFAGYIDEQ